MKKNEEKNPVQVKAKNALENKLAEKAAEKEAGESEAPKKKPVGRPPGSKNKKAKTLKAVQEPFDREAALIGASAMAEMIETARQGLGITAPLNPMIKSSFIQGLVQMEEKYGDAMAKYMPELMFFGSATMITVDTIKQIKIIKMMQNAPENEVEEPEQKKETPKTKPKKSAPKNGKKTGPTPGASIPSSVPKEK